MRTCSADNCNRPVFGTDKNTNKGYCSSHQWMRTDKKKTPKIMEKQEKTPIEYSFGFTNQQDMFFALWEKAREAGRGDVVCPFTGQTLLRYYRTPLWWQCFAHVLPKGRYPYFKLNPDNMRLVIPPFHKLIDQGTYDQRKLYPGWKWTEWDNLVFEMKEKYAQFKKDNLLP